VVSVAPWNLCNATLKRAEAGEFDHASDNAKTVVIHDLIRGCSSAVAVLALQPFPGIDSAFVAPIHQRMIGVIARVHGYRVDNRAIDQDILGPLGAEILVSHVAMVAAKLLPFVDIFAVCLAYALTVGIGRASHEYYRRHREMTEAEMRRLFDAHYTMAYEHAYKEKRNELRAMFRDASVRQRIRELKKARRDGTIEDEEVERRIDEILSRR
jgi:uncharacterized protein (DUF697 family)